MNQKLVVASELSVVVVVANIKRGEKQWGKKKQFRRKIWVGCDYGGSSQIAGSVRL